MTAVPSVPEERPVRTQRLDGPWLYDEGGALVMCQNCGTNEAMFQTFYSNTGWTDECFDCYESNREANE